MMKKAWVVISFFAVCPFLSCQNATATVAGEHFAEINGIVFHYTVSGKGPVCILPTPGWGMGSDIYVKSLKPIEQYFTMVYFETRKSGKSGGPDDASQYTSEFFLSDLRAFQRYLGAPKVWLMGHSTGGFQVLNYGIHYSESLWGIIALAPRVVEDQLWADEVDAAVMRRSGEPFFQNAYSALNADSDQGMSEHIQGIMPFYFHNLDNMRRLLALSSTPISDEAAELAGEAGFASENLLPSLHDISVPTLVVVGDDDFICGKASQADRVVEAVPGATEIVVKDAGHFSWIEQRDEFFSQVIAWIRDNETR
jgi:proline iminopeptidase